MGILFRCFDEEREEIKVRAGKAGLTMSEYLVELVKRDDLDAAGRPVWADHVDRGDQLEPSA